MTIIVWFSYLNLRLTRLLLFYGDVFDKSLAKGFEIRIKPDVRDEPLDKRNWLKVGSWSLMVHLRPKLIPPGK
jgi:hypothetical protein